MKPAINEINTLMSQQNNSSSDAANPKDYTYKKGRPVDFKAGGPCTILYLVVRYGSIE